MKIKKFNENSEYIPEVYDLELKTIGTPNEILERLQRISNGIKDAIESEENTEVMLDGVDGEMWDIDNVDFKISY